MMHKQRRWCVEVAPSAEELARLLTKHTWTGCTAFRLPGADGADYYFLNDATSGDGGQEYAVLKLTAEGRYLQLESITFSWCSFEDYVEVHITSRPSTSSVRP